MTFILALANSEEVIQISDCSVVQGGDIEEAKFNKAGHILCDDASVLYGFTGLAEVDGGEKIQHDVQDWMLDALDIAMIRAFESSGQTGYHIEEIELELAYVATLHFRHAMFLGGVEEEDRRLTIMLTGYMNDGRITHTLISNCMGSATAEPEFKLIPTKLKPLAKGEPTLIQAIGKIGGLAADEERGIRGLLESKAPAESIRDHAAAIVASRRRGDGDAGRKITTAILRKDAPDLPMLEYKSNEAGDTRTFLDFVRCRKGQPVRLSKNVFGARSDREGGVPEEGYSVPLPEQTSLCRDDDAVPQGVIVEANFQQTQPAPEEASLKIAR